jgi:5'-nucleotidase, C-terminal domain/MacB-like periplasmic core domain
VRRNHLVDPAQTGGIAVMAVDPSLPDTVGASVAQGRFLDAATGRYPTVVLGAEAAERLGIGRTGVRVWLGDRWFTVIGILQVSAGFTYTYNATLPAGSRVSNLALGGAPISPAASYRVAMNSFLADGGDGFTVFREGTDQLGGEIDLDALARYLGANSPVAPGPQNRITRAP